MIIREYTIILDEKEHPQLREVHSYEWNGRDIKTYDKIERMVRECFHSDNVKDEYIYVLSLDPNLDILGVYIISYEEAMSTKDSMKDLCIFLLLSGATQYALVRNHPEGALTISEEDWEITRKVKQAANCVNVELMGSMVVAEKGHRLIKEEEFFEVTKLVDDITGK